jgi:hypothetical protein
MHELHIEWLWVLGGPVVVILQDDTVTSKLKKNLFCCLATFAWPSYWMTLGFGRTSCCYSARLHGSSTIFFSHNFSTSFWSHSWFGFSMVFPFKFLVISPSFFLLHFFPSLFFLFRVYSFIEFSYTYILYVHIQWLVRTKIITRNLNTELQGEFKSKPNCLIILPVLYVWGQFMKKII